MFGVEKAAESFNCYFAFFIFPIFIVDGENFFEVINSFAKLTKNADYSAGVGDVPPPHNQHER